ncbi:YjfI family protein [Microvirga sp. SRT01]|uniref:YjfI family protein n=1 Tax=Sphingomonas longa TaxID=2778730 RepID=A0ABS2DC65_9SPHN|nr:MULTISPECIES: YjfI family protein [Alphaproteobacteria]MBM6577636.1 YjfI family protein [Sphingomonas sp. BT552]MBR7710681.1 YjfI family protein [Microvirga sp. SRT01]
MTDIAWTVRTLKAALDLSEPVQGGEFGLRIVEGADPVLLVTMHNHGDLEAYVNVSAEQIAASVLLWPCDEQPDRAAFNEFLLKAQKLVPLSNFGIATVDGRDFYELFGELATTSSPHTIIIELRALAENAIEAATDLRTSFANAA